ncbi:MAG: hypothetical protein JO110_17180 [Acetobacteraceae bacterium]|nr:hypothetical protein [Acetobacteraceae bacterium]
MTLDRMGELDNGLVRAMVDAAIAEAVTDLEDRGKDGKVREVDIKVKLKLTDGGGVATKVACKAVLPPRASHTTFGDFRVRPGVGVQMTFQSNNPERPDQGTFMDAEDESGGSSGKGK